MTQIDEDSQLIFGVIKSENKPDELIPFSRIDILHYIILTPEYKSDLQRVADILAANVEDPDVNLDGFVEIDSKNFNDSFYDMMAELEGNDWDDWDELSESDWNDEHEDDDNEFETYA